MVALQQCGSTALKAICARHLGDKFLSWVIGPLVIAESQRLAVAATIGYAGSGVKLHVLADSKHDSGNIRVPEWHGYEPTLALTRSPCGLFLNCIRPA